MVPLVLLFARHTNGSIWHEAIYFSTSVYMFIVAFWMVCRTFSSASKCHTCMCQLLTRFRHFNFCKMQRLIIYEPANMPITCKYLHSTPAKHLKIFALNILGITVLKFYLRRYMILSDIQSEIQFYGDMQAEP